MSNPSARVPLFVAGMAALTCLGFAAFTGHIWEDYFITFRSSLNLATGHGFVFQPGERVHTFTSPLGTLLPALFALGGGDDVALRALWIFRVVSALALGGALWLAARTLLRAGLTAAVVVGAGLVWALDPKTVDFSINGMESALLIFFVVVTWRAFVDGAKLLPCALGFAGLQWTRPDGCVFLRRWRSRGFFAVSGRWPRRGEFGFGSSRARCCSARCSFFPGSCSPGATMARRCRTRSWRRCPSTVRVNSVARCASIR